MGKAESMSQKGSDGAKAESGNWRASRPRSEGKPT